MEAEDTDSSSEGEAELGIETLSAETLAALTGHLQAKQAAEREEEGELVSENFGLSQFWYNDRTQQDMAQELLDHAKGGQIAILSAPSVMNGMQALDGGKDRPGLFIFEYDDRFGVAYPHQFVHYDFNEPELVPDHLKGSCDYILADPPYLNNDTIKLFFKTMQLLARRPWIDQRTSTDSTTADGTSHSSESTPMMFITSPMNHKLLCDDLGLRRVPYELQFQSKFSTPMSMYLSYRSERFGDFIEEEPDIE